MKTIYSTISLIIFLVLFGFVCSGTPGSPKKSETPAKKSEVASSKGQETKGLDAKQMIENEVSKFKEELKKDLNDWKAKENSTYKNKLDSLHNVIIKDIDLRNKQNIHITHLIVLFIIFCLLVISISFSLFQRKVKDRDRRENIINTVLDSQRINDKIRSINTSESSKSPIDNENSIVAIINKVINSRLEEDKKKKDLVNKEYINMPKQETISKPEEKFLKEKEGILIFKEAAEENSYYKLFDIKGAKASFQFCGNEEIAIANYDGILKDVFDDEMTYSSRAKQIKNISSGTVEQQPDGKWRIIIPAKINFI